MACVNNVPPLQLPITKVSTTVNGYGASTHGIAVSIGEPSQFFSMRPSASDNDTWVYNVNSCANNTDYQCIARLGGLYDPKVSNTKQITNSLGSWNGTPDTEFDTSEYLSYVFFNDIFKAGSEKDIYGYPFFAATEGNDLSNVSAQAGLGLGHRSVFLEAVVESGIAPSRQYSVWPGVDSSALPVDGMLMVGGYDEARKGGDWVNFTSNDQDAPLFVEIADITWESTPGNITSIFPPYATTLLGRLEPFADALYFPVDWYENFRTVTNATYNLTLDKLVYNWLEAPTGTLTYTLSNGYQTRINGSDLFDFPLDYDSSGQEVVTDRGLVAAKVEIDPYTYPGYPVWLGVPFLTMNYVVADNDNNMFRMAPAVRDDFGQSHALNPKSLCTQTHSTPAPPSAPNHTAAIAGGVGGGVGGLLLIGVLIALFFCLRRRKRRAAAQQQQQETVQEGKAPYEPATKIAPSEATGTSELPSPVPQHVAQWLSTTHGEDLSPEPPSELSATSYPFEMPANYSR